MIEYLEIYYRTGIVGVFAFIITLAAPIMVYAAFKKDLMLSLRRIPLIISAIAFFAVYHSIAELLAPYFTVSQVFIVSMIPILAIVVNTAYMPIAFKKEKET